jgi:hypothetical protein
LSFQLYNPPAVAALAAPTTQHHSGSTGIAGPAHAAVKPPVPAMPAAPATTTTTRSKWDDSDDDDDDGAAARAAPAAAKSQTPHLGAVGGMSATSNASTPYSSTIRGTPPPPGGVEQALGFLPPTLSSSRYYGSSQDGSALNLGGASGYGSGGVRSQRDDNPLAIQSTITGVFGRRY